MRKALGAAQAVSLVVAVAGGAMSEMYQRYKCVPSWCGGTREQPCRTAIETDGTLHDDELDALEAQDEEER